MAAHEDEEARNEIAALKERFRAAKDAADSLERLVGGPVRHHYPIDLWALSDNELDNEMGKRLGFLNEDIDCRPTAAITSHRRVIGPLIVFFKKLLLKALGPYTNSLFLRQNRFNEQLVAFHLASFIRFRRLEEKLQRGELTGGEARARDAATGCDADAPPTRHE